jgi:hypothetical protein
MSDDPIKDLEDFNQQGLNVNPLPPPEVRRLGDRMRRRNAAFAAVGAAAAIAVIVTPLAVFAGGRDHAEPPVTTPSVSHSESPSESPSGTDPSASEPTNQPIENIEIPEGFPLADGLPDSGAEPGQPGLQGPNRTLEPLTFSACGSSFDEPPHVDQLLASWTNVEDYRDRQLTTFEDAAQAVTYVKTLTDFYRTCPEEDGGQAGNSIVHKVSRTAVGGESWAVVTHYEFDGAPTVGLTVVHVIRLGRAVLIDTTSNEGSGPDGNAQIQAQTNATVDVVSAMCFFTESGC